jgi:hypothetical protein
MADSNVTQLPTCKVRAAKQHALIEKLTPAMKRGGLLAVDLLEELAQRANEPMCCVDDEWREKGTPQKNLVADFIGRLAAPEELQGFGRVLTEAMGAEAAGNTLDLAYLECLATTPAQRIRAVWAARLKRDLRAAKANAARVEVTHG